MNRSMAFHNNQCLSPIYVNIPIIVLRLEVLVKQFQKKTFNFIFDYL